MFADEIIRTLIGSIALVLAVPLTTAIGVAIIRTTARNHPPQATTHNGPPPLD